MQQKAHEKLVKRKTMTLLIGVAPEAEADAIDVS